MHLIFDITVEALMIGHGCSPIFVLCICVNTSCLFHTSMCQFNHIFNVILKFEKQFAMLISLT